MGMSFERSTVSLPRGWKEKARLAGINMSGLLRANLREKLDLTPEEVEKYRSDLLGTRRQRK